MIRTDPTRPPRVPPRSPGLAIPSKVRLLLAALAAGAAAAVPADASTTTSAAEPASLTHAREIRVAVDARYRHVSSRRKLVAEATTTGVVQSITLITDWLEGRVVPADDGIYYAICSARARCPYPARSAAWPVESFLPRRQALELALRTFLETSASLVVVALPTIRPVWVVFEREDLTTDLDIQQTLDRLEGDPAAMDKPLLELVDRLTRPRLFLPLPILPPPDDTIYAVRLPIP